MVVLILAVILLCLALLLLGWALTPSPAVQETKRQEEAVRSESSHPSGNPASAEYGAVPPGKEGGCGCICILVLYYLVGLTFCDQVLWPEEWVNVLLYVLGPFIWPAIVGGFAPVPALQIPLGLLALAAYAYVLRNLLRPKSGRAILFCVIALILLFMASFGGCAVAFNRSMDGVCDGSRLKLDTTILHAFAIKHINVLRIA